MEKKYIIKLEENEIAYKTVNSNGRPMIGLLHPSPYTEPDLEQVRKEAYRQGYDTGYGTKVNEFYEQGLTDAWDAARNVIALSTVDRREVFGSEYMYSILEKHTASEAIEKIRQYEQPVTAEDVMRQYLDTFCRGRSCSGCPLNTPDFTCGRGYHFLTAEPVSDEEVRRAYAKVLQKGEVE